MKLEKTRLKLLESQTKGELVGFVSRHPKAGRLLGVREDSHYGKKICLLSDHLKGKLRSNILYEVSVKPMRSGAGYVIVEAQQILFVAKVETIIIPNATYKVTVKFGNKNIYFDPLNGRTPSSTTVEGVLSILEQREDIQNKAETIQSFIMEASRMHDRMVEDGVLHNNEHLAQQCGEIADSACGGLE